MIAAMRALVRKAEALPAWAWLSAAFLARAAFALRAGDGFRQVDEMAYASLGRDLAARGLSALAQPHVAPPAAGLALAPFFLAGPSLVHARLGQALTGTLLVWLVSRLTAALSKSERAARLALALAAVYPFFVYYCGMLLSETTYLVLLCAAFWQLARGAQERDVRSSALGGFLLGAAALARPEGFFVALLVWLAAGLLCLRRAWSRPALGAALLCWLLPLAGWSLRNKRVEGSYRLDYHGGITLYIGAAHYEQNERDTAEAMKAVEAEPVYAEALKLSPVESDKLFTRAAFAYMRAHPLETLGHWASKLLAFWRFYPRVDKSYAQSPGFSPDVGTPRWGLVVASLLFEPALLLGGLAGFWLSRKRWDAWLPLWAFVLGTTLIHMVSVSQMRYRLPVMPAFIAGLCVLIAALCDKPSAR